MRRDDEFSQFFTSRFDHARRSAFALCGNWSEAEEIAQGAFVKVYAKWPRVRRDSAEAYLQTVMTRIFLDARRRVRGRERSVAEPPDVVSHDPAVPERQGLMRALQEVPPRQRAALVLRFVLDLSVEQAADALGCSPGTVKSQTARGLETLRAAYLTTDTSERA
ncbi:MAG: SigE family RNA polymerase sigma factor [Umezawaea sp.]